jgi:RND family efflux transporter MFP subunit
MLHSVPSAFHLGLRAAIWAFLPLLLSATLWAQGTDPTGPNFATNESANRGSLRSVLRPISDIRLSAKAAGIIERFHVEEGASLRAGDPILSLDMDAERAELMQTEAMVRGTQAELERATAEYERVKPLSAENIYSEKQLLEARTTQQLASSRHAQAEAAVVLARARLANRTLISPIDGIFLKTNKSVGEAVDRFETVARVVDASRLEMVVYADAKHFAALHRIQTVNVKVFISSNSEPIVNAVVAHIDPIIDPSSGTFRVKLLLAAAAGVAPGYPAILLLPELSN